jgi:hypothetical protein
MINTTWILRAVGGCDDEYSEILGVFPDKYRAIEEAKKQDAEYDYNQELVYSRLIIAEYPNNEVVEETIWLTVREFEEYDWEYDEDKI